MGEQHAPIAPNLFIPFFGLGPAFRHSRVERGPGVISSIRDNLWTDVVGLQHRASGSLFRKAAILDWGAFGCATADRDLSQCYTDRQGGQISIEWTTCCYVSVWASSPPILDWATDWLRLHGDFAPSSPFSLHGGIFNAQLLAEAPVLKRAFLTSPTPSPRLDFQPAGVQWWAALTFTFCRLQA